MGPEGLNKKTSNLRLNQQVTEMKSTFDYFRASALIIDYD
jgi:hypothetical protein